MTPDFIKDYLWNEHDVDNDYDLDRLSKFIWENLDLAPIYTQIDKLMNDLKASEDY